MPLLNLRELLQFPGGDNATDTVINGIHFNLSALEYFNYTIYDNGTISNSSRCYLIFDHHQPVMMSNGSWVNGTSCYFPYYSIRTRGAIGIAYAALFGASIMFTLINLRKHGRLFLREDKRFRVIGRRWQWYWMCFVAACGMISTITSVDVDRNYLQSLPIILQSFFFTLMLPGTLAMVWEAVRHWGSWQERQIYDRDPFLLPQDDRRGKVEFYLPLVFYLFAWLSFFMEIPRSWTRIQFQRSPWQQSHYAEPTATDGRFKAGAIFSVISWIVIIVSLRHSLHYYRPKPSSGGIMARIESFCTYCPTKLFLALVILAIRLAYALASVWIWEVSLLKYDVEPGWPYGLGYGTTILLLILFNVFGYIDENEDRLIIEQRRDRGQAADAELGVTKKPSWWRKAHGDLHLTPEQRLRALTSEGPGANRQPRNPSLPAANVELTEMSGNPPSYYDVPGSGGQVRNRSRQRADNAPENPFRDPDDTGSGDRRHLGRADSDDNASTATGTTERTGMTGETLAENYPPQRIRSMLDV
ncbi:hypothetical protein GTA08_BOTSDO06709 [Botryosphaeria dothidea]|uniref:Uncharacterized protein n=1 Tax=Botryosphaeria dothidea TaxID=55169 RepID=A0A8H4IRD5_9PEZI|nr:hypothetical protein GTA08_BOTSDO06709 [Botryosphaeria dothidea]